MQILVQHAKTDRNTGSVLGYTDVALVNVPVEISAFSTTNECLEYAYRYTNNVAGSWSINEEYLPLRDGKMIINGDYNENVTVLYTRPDGMGQRSSMMGDRFIVDGVVYKCAVFGFKKVELENA
jgi:hypothetical protein